MRSPDDQSWPVVALHRAFPDAGPMVDPAPSPPAPRRRSLRRALLWAPVLAAAFTLPRALCLRGISQAAIVEFADMADHLYFLDLVGKRRTLSPEQVNDPFFKAFRLSVNGSVAWPHAGVYSVNIVTEGSGMAETANGRVDLAAGDTFTILAGTAPTTISGDLQMLVTTPSFV